MMSRTAMTTLLAFASLTTAAFSQGGPLTPPPGAPAPGMKSLDQIEPRIPLVAGAPGVSISSGSITISQPGSYYLTSNHTYTGSGNAITIIVDGVTLDLMGHSIIRPTGGNSSYAINIAANNVTVCNGHVISGTTFNGSSFTASGFQYGVFADSNRTGISIRNLSVHGSRHRGIYLVGDATLVESCSVVICPSIGIQATIVRDSVALTTGFTSITGSLVEGCVARCVGSATGISADIVTRCKASSTGDTGISAVSSVSHSEGVSTAAGTGHRGIICTPGNVSHSRGTSTSGDGIYGVIVSHSVGQATGTSGFGIRATNLAYASSGTSSGSHGVSSLGSVHSCYGSTTHASVHSHGIRAERMVSHSTAFVSTGGLGSAISSALVVGSYGQVTSDAKHGITASLVTHSWGWGGSAADSYGITATRAVGCIAYAGELISFKADMP